MMLHWHHSGPAESQLYSINRRTDGAWQVTSATTAEGPDVLTNVQRLVFADRDVSLQAAPTISDERVFAFAARAYPSIFSGTPSIGNYQQFHFAYFPESRNYVAVDALGGAWVLGPYTNDAIVFVGMVDDFRAAILGSETQ